MLTVLCYTRGGERRSTLRGVARLGGNDVLPPTRPGLDALSAHVTALSPAPMVRAGSYLPAYVIGPFTTQDSKATGSLHIPQYSISITMSDNDVATRAPESDAQEATAASAGQSVFPGDTRAQEGPSMGVSRQLPAMRRLLTLLGTLHDRSTYSFRRDTNRRTHQARRRRRIRRKALRLPTLALEAPAPPHRRYRHQVHEQSATS